MAIFKCKMCGANLEVAEGAVTATCEYCASMQTLPAANDELVQNLFNRANALRLKCEFDKAEQIYEKIVQEDDAEAEAHWGIVLCKYGIEYVEDPKTMQRIPTCHRTSYDAVVTDADYLAAVKHADVARRSIYEAEARQIDGIQRSILDIVKNEKPFDVFLCYKQSDENGKRTPDSAIANDIYHQLTQEGLKVFFAAITLEDKLGQAYEPYIFAALNSAKVMLVIGTKPHYFSAVWVKNEWSRFMKLMQTDRSKLLIPCYKDMDAYELPEEFAHLQAQDMSKIGFINDIVRGIKKVTVKDEPKATVIKETVVSGNASTAPLLKRAFMFLEDGDWSAANEYCEKVLDMDPECAMAYVGKLMAELKVKKQDDLKNQANPFDQNGNYQKAVRFADAELKTILIGYNEFIVNRNLETAYQKANNAMKSANTEKNFKSAAAQFQTIKDFKDSAELANQCLALAEEARLKAIAEAEAAKQKAELERLEREYQNACKEMRLANDAKSFRRVATLFKPLHEYKDAAELFQKCTQTAEDMQKDDIILRAMVSIKQDTIVELESAIEILQGVAGWKNANALIAQCEDRIAQIEAEMATAAAEYEKRRRKKNTITAVVMIALALVAVYLVLLFVEIIPGGKYNDAVALMESGKYEEAIAIFNEIKTYKDSEVKIYACNNAIVVAELDEKYNAAVGLMNEAKYEAAKNAFQELGGFKDSTAKAEQCDLMLKEIKYTNAVALMNEGKYEEAISLFTTLYGYKDSTERNEQCKTAINEQKYSQAVSLMASGDYNDAIAILTELNGYKDSAELIGSYYYNQGETCEKSGNNALAAIMYFAAKDYKDAHTKCETLWDKCAVRQTVYAGHSYTAAIKNDGTVITTGNNDHNNCDVSTWKNIIAICGGYGYILGLKDDGTVVATGRSEHGSLNVGNWTKIVALDAGETTTVGLKADGTVVAVGNNESGQCNVDGWTNIISISTGGRHTVGLRTDGTVVAVGDNSSGQCDVTGWTDIIAISAGLNHTVGLKADGTVVAVGYNYSGQCNVTSWKGIVSVCAGQQRTMAVKKDGTIVVTGASIVGTTWNVSSVKNVVSISLAATHFVAVKKDGTVYVDGNAGKGQYYNVGSWGNIKVPKN